MESIDCTYRSQTSIPTEATTVFVSLELSRARWLVTSLSPNTSKISRHFVPGGDAAELLRLLSELRAKAERHVNAAVKITCIQEIGFDGFWIHRVLAANGIESHVVEAASIAVPRRHRRAKTDTIDGELLLRTLMAFKRGEPRVCAMVVVPTPEEEDRRRLSRERKEQGISKSENARLRTTMIEAAWLWLRHQPKSALSLWFKNRVKADRGRHRRVAIVALARKLLIAFWRFATDGEIPEGAELKIA